MTFEDFNTKLHPIFSESEALNRIPLETILKAIPRIDALADLPPGTPVLIRADLDTPLEGVVHGYPLRARSVQPRWYGPFLGTASWFYRGAPFPVWQVLWPDRGGRFPWERESADHVSILQPLLVEKSATAARTVPFLRALRLAWEDEA